MVETRSSKRLKATLSARQPLQQDEKAVSKLRVKHTKVALTPPLFRFFELPPELRQFVYKFVFEVNYVVYEFEFIGRRSAIVYEANRRWGIRGSNLNHNALLQTCKQIFAEAINCYLSMGHFVAYIDQHPGHMPVSLGANGIWSKVKRLTLAYDLVTYLNSTGTLEEIDYQWLSSSNVSELVVALDLPTMCKLFVVDAGIKPGNMSPISMGLLQEHNLRTICNGRIVKSAEILPKLRAALPLDAVLFFNHIFQDCMIYHYDHGGRVKTQELWQRNLYVNMSLFYKGVVTCEKIVTIGHRYLVGTYPVNRIALRAFPASAV